MPFVQAGLDCRKVRYLYSWARGDELPFRLLLDYDGVRYHLLLEVNEQVPDCAENQCLRALHKAFHEDEASTDPEDDCTDLFWHFIAEHSKPCRKEARSLAQGGGVKSLVRIQVFTDGDGKLCATERDDYVKFPSCDPVMNPCENAAVFRRSEVRRLEDIDAGIYKAIIEGVLYCVKKVYRSASEDCFLRELQMLAKSGRISNVIPFFGVVEADTEDGKIDGIVLKYITDYICLSKITSATLTQKNKWMQQISDAVTALHEAEVVWGDAMGGNVLIDGATNDAFLVDFGGGYTKGWVDEELSNTDAGDNQGLSRILKYLDSLPTSK